MREQTGYTIQTFPASRLFTEDIGKLGMRRHHIKALIDVDVTEPRRRIAEIKRKSGGVSFTSWVIKCIGQAVAEHRQVHGLRKGKRKTVIFDDVDLSLMVEKVVKGVPVPLPLVLRSVNARSIQDIHAEIEEARMQTADGDHRFVLKEKRDNRMASLLSRLPQFLRLLIWRMILRNPHRVRRMMGTVMVTSVGMMGSVNGWFIPYSIHPLCFALGAIISKPGFVRGRAALREYLNLTILIDHDVIDGAPAARFVSRLVECMEGGYALS